LILSDKIWALEVFVPTVMSALTWSDQIMFALSYARRYNFSMVDSFSLFGLSEISEEVELVLFY
jgi:hypothetical protein